MKPTKRLICALIAAMTASFVNGAPAQPQRRDFKTATVVCQPGPGVQLNVRIFNRGSRGANMVIQFRRGRHITRPGGRPPPGTCAYYLTRGVIPSVDYIYINETSKNFWDYRCNGSACRMVSLLSPRGVIERTLAFWRNGRPIFFAVRYRVRGGGNPTGVRRRPVILRVSGNPPVRGGTVTRRPQR